MSRPTTNLLKFLWHLVFLELHLPRINCSKKISSAANVKELMVSSRQPSRAHKFLSASIFFFISPGGKENKSWQKERSASPGWPWPTVGFKVVQSWWWVLGSCGLSLAFSKDEPTSKHGKSSELWLTTLKRMKLCCNLFLHAWILLLFQSKSRIQA
jgi:hypothetical protein